MAHAKTPGPLGSSGVESGIEDGTFVRNASPLPGPIGSHPASHTKPRPTVYHGSRKSGKGLPTLREGVRNEYVRRLQILLNKYNAANPPLKQDGYFGAKTLAAVTSFQRFVSLSPNGVVGMQTWLKVLAGSHETRLKTPAPSVADWSLRQRFEGVLNRTPNHLAPELAAQFWTMLTPVNVGIISASFATWAVLHAFGAGEIADISMVGVGAVFLGMGVLKAGEDLGECLMITLHAEKSTDLDQAADYLAQAIAILGILTFFALIAKVGAKFGRAVPAAEEDAAATSAETFEKPALKDKPPEPASHPEKSIASDLENAEFNGVKLRVRPGANDKVAVIGRSMDGVVNPYAQGPGAKYNVETFGGDQISPEAQAEWKSLKNKYYPDPIPSDVVRNSLMFQDNQAWANKLVDQGYTVVDADNPEGQAASPFYDMEKQVLFGDLPAGAKQ